MDRFIADLHLSHKNMAVYRGFTSVEEHDEYIISKWNSVVGKRDTTYVLGDITMEKRTNYELLSQLNGTIIVVGGNHDQRQHTKSMLEYVNGFAGVIKYSNKKGFKAWLTHIPVHTNELDRCPYNIHGHIHKANVKTWYGMKDKRYICVSCEQVDYTPKTIEELVDNLK